MSLPLATFKGFLLARLVRNDKKRTGCAAAARTRIWRAELAYGLPPSRSVGTPASRPLAFAQIPKKIFYRALARVREALAS